MCAVIVLVHQCIAEVWFYAVSTVFSYITAPELLSIILVLGKVPVVKQHDMSRPARKPTLWTLRKVSTRISLSMPHRLTRIDTSRLL